MLCRNMCILQAPGSLSISHSMDKIDAVLSGRFRMVLEGREAVLEAGDMLAVPRGALHSTEVIGNESVVSVDATNG